MKRRTVHVDANDYESRIEIDVVLRCGRMMMTMIFLSVECRLVMTWPFVLPVLGLAVFFLSFFVFLICREQKP